MLVWTKRIAIGLVGVLALAVFGLWLVLSSSILAGTRGDLTAQVLSKKLGQDVQINGGVSIDLGSILKISVDGAVLPSQTMKDVMLAEMTLLTFDVPLSDLLKGRITLSDVQVDGAKIMLVVDKDGTNSWAQSAAKSLGGKTTDAGSAKTRHPVSYFGGQKVRFSNVGVLYKDAVKGWDLDLSMSSLDMQKKTASAPLDINGTGTLNGEALTLTASFPKQDPFKASLNFSQITMEFDGTPEKGGYEDGYSTAISLKVSKIGQLLDVLKLKKPISGSGQASAVLKVSGKTLSVNDLSALFTLDGGQSLELSGDLGVLGVKTDITIDTKIRLYPKDKRPPPTKNRQDLKLIAVDMAMTANPGGLPQRHMVIETNGFTLDTHGEGPPPISASEVSRTQDGLLRIGKVILRIGPPAASFLVLEGALEDALGLDGLDAKGTLTLPAASLLAPELFQTSEVLGTVAGGFSVKGNIHELGLSDLKVGVTGSDLWTLDVTGSVKNAMTFSDVKLDVAADIPSGANLLSALTLEPVKTGEVKLNAQVSSEGTKWKAGAKILVGKSDLGIEIDFDMTQADPTLRGQIESGLIDIGNLREIIAAALQLGKLKHLEAAASEKNAPDNKKGGETADQAKPQKTESTQTAETSTAPETGPIQNVTLLPLGQAILLSGMDADVDIDLKKIEGEKGITSTKSELVMKGEKATLGPLKFEYGDGRFDVTGVIDLAKDPKSLKVTGSTGGWHFEKILRELKFKKGASGVLYADFDVQGHHTSVQDFLGSASGYATISMRQGSIDTQLLDVAGLGVLPWLFSKHHGKTAPIVCLRAPLHLSDGKVTSKQIVVETDEVQLVVYGDVNLKNKTVDVQGQPRKIGKPLSRSPWPFSVVGPLAKPKIKVKDGPKRLARSDGAKKMPKDRKACVPDILQLK